MAKTKAPAKKTPAKKTAPATGGLDAHREAVAACKAAGLSCKGSTADLKARLAEHQAKPVESEGGKTD